jgi:hypothetical protein
MEYAKLKKLGKSRERKKISSTWSEQEIHEDGRKKKPPELVRSSGTSSFV